MPAGRWRDDLVSTADLYPTLLAYAGVTAASDRPGTNLRPLIEGGRPPGRAAVIGSTTFVRVSEDRIRTANPRWRREAASHLTTAKWHYVHNETRSEEHLYARDGGDDGDEPADRIATHPELAREFRAQIEAWKADLLRALEP